METLEIDDVFEIAKNRGYVEIVCNNFYCGEITKEKAKEIIEFLTKFVGEK